MIHSEASLGFLRILTPYSNLRGRPTHPDTGSNDSLPQNFLSTHLPVCIYTKYLASVSLAYLTICL